MSQVRKRDKKQTVDQMVDHIMSLPERTKLQLLAPVVRGRKGTHVKLLEQAKEADLSVFRLTEACMNCQKRLSWTKYQT